MAFEGNNADKLQPKSWTCEGIALFSPGAEDIENRSQLLRRALNSRKQFYHAQCRRLYVIFSLILLIVSFPTMACCGPVQLLPIFQVRLKSGNPF